LRAQEDTEIIVPMAKKDHLELWLMKLYFDPILSIGVRSQWQAE
jgi:hypothetical protein